MTIKQNTSHEIDRYAKAVLSSIDRMDGLLKEMREKRGSPTEASNAKTLALEIELATEYTNTLKKLNLERSIENYLTTKGRRCLNCRSENIEGIGSWEADEDYVTHGVVCTDCRTVWHDGYTLSFVADVDRDDVTLYGGDDG